MGKGRLTDEIKSLKQKLTKLKAEILALKLSVTSYQETIETCQEGINDTTALKEDRQAFCGSEDAQWNFVNADMQNQITTCGNAIYLMEDKRELLERYR